MKYLGVLLASSLLAFAPTLAAPQRSGASHRFAHSKKAKGCTPTVANLEKCPPQGCGGGDQRLNVKKNRTDAPSSDYQVTTFANFMHLEEERPTQWTQNHVRDTVVEMGEDTPVVLAGYMISAHEGSPETCNCKLAGEENNDYHINIVERPGDRLRDSIVVEMTPKMRAKIPEWRLDRLNGLVTDPNNPPLVRVSGYLLFDSEHVSRSGGERATIWEIHPVNKFEVCRDRSCTADSDTGWQDIRTSQP